MIFCFALKAQENAQTILMESQPSSVSVDNGQVFTVDVNIKNNTTGNFHGSLHVQLPGDLELVSREVLEVSIKPKSKQFLTIYVNVPYKTSSRSDLKVIVELQDDDENSIRVMSIPVHINSTRHIELLLPQDIVQIEEKSDSVSVPVKLTNSGNSEQLVRLMARFPSSGFETGEVVREYIIPPFSDTLVYVKYPVTTTLRSSNNFPVNVNAVYGDGDIAGSAVVKVDYLMHMKKYTEVIDPRYSRFKGFAGANNSLEVNSQYTFTDYQSFQILGGNDLLINKTLVRYHFDAQVWKQDERPSYVRNTFIDIKQDNNGLVIGNISKNYDMALYGRGVMVYGNDSTRSKSFEAGWMDENYNLIGKKEFSIGQVAWGKYAVNKSRWGITTVGISNNNTQIDEHQQQLSGNSWFKAGDNLKFTINGGLGYSTSDHSDLSKISGLGRARIEGNYGMFVFSTDNTVSSPYYAGYKRGVMSFEQRLGFNARRYNYTVSFTSYQFKPEFLVEENNTNSIIRSKTAQFCFSGPLVRNVGFAIIPQYYAESNQYPRSDLVTAASINSLGAIFQLNYSDAPNEQFLQLSNEAGYYQAPLINSQQQSSFHDKINLTARMSWFNLNVYGQFGEFYAADVMVRYLQEEGYTKSVVVTPFIQNTFYHNRIKVEGGVSFYKSNVNLSGNQMNGRVDYFLKNGFDRIYASLRVYNYENNSLAANDLRIGYVTGLSQGHIVSGRSTLQLFVFKDMNSNGKFDEGDSIAGDFVLNVNGELLYTDINGKAEYNRLPKGNYRLSVPAKDGWDAPAREIFIETSTKMNIPLRKSGILFGKIDYIKPTDISYDVSQWKEQLVVRAIGSDGTVHTTKTDEKGNFIFYIPPDRYMIEIRPVDLPDKVDCLNCSQHITIIEGMRAEVSFTFKIKEHDVSIKKFVSPNLQK